MATDTPGDPRADQGAARRPASVQLRETSVTADSAALMDPAHKSLADALRITFWILKGAMVLLAVLFVLSGFQSVEEGEQGIRLMFGRPSDKTLGPGLQPSWPYPVGEMVHVNTGLVLVRLNRTFMPELRAQDEILIDTNIEEVASRSPGRLSPERDGGQLTGDGNIAHTQWTVQYRRETPRRWVENLHPDYEEQIVRVAVQRAAVRAVAGVGIDDLLKQSSSDAGSAERRAWEDAQAMLDDLDSGLRIEMLRLERKLPPLSLYEEFARVEGAQSEANRIREEAESDARQTLNTVAGTAVPYLIDQITRYEQAIALDDQPAQQRILAVIDALLEGRPVEIDGQTVERVISGEVTTILNDARRYRTNIVAQSRADLAYFEAKLDQFRQNPRVMVHTDWADAVQAFAARQNVQRFQLPPGVNELVLKLNVDPEIRKAREMAARRAANEQAAQRREQERQQNRYRLDDNQAISAGPGG